MTEGLGMRFGFGKRENTPGAVQPDTRPAARAAPPSEAAAWDAAAPIRVYSMGPSQEMRWTVELLAARGIAFEEVDVSGDAALQSWVAQQTNSREYPQVFRDRILLGDLRELRRLDLEGNLERALAGLPAVGSNDPTSDEDSVRGAAAVHRRLRRGDVLSLTTPDGETFDTWAEVYANPPQVYYRGEPRPIEDLDEVVDEIATLLEDPGTEAAWSTGR
jgi:glutaredoxin